ncbi:hypothetical protein ILYODFUR_018740 [Ilyodon furcidens]|uniref:Uncharacterized protein n=1 Tax=Ilyodon furcidens TaxID=33524 RepID=A0ABV0TVS4_9TELE
MQVRAHTYTQTMKNVYKHVQKHPLGDQTCIYLHKQPFVHKSLHNFYFSFTEAQKKRFGKWLSSHAEQNLLDGEQTDPNGMYQISLREKACVLHNAPHSKKRG